MVGMYAAKWWSQLRICQKDNKPIQICEPQIEDNKKPIQEISTSAVDAQKYFVKLQTNQLIGIYISLMWNTLLTLYMIIYFTGNIGKNYLQFISFLHTNLTGGWNPSSCKTKNLPFLHNQYHGCRCPGDASSQGISNHDIYCIEPE